MSRYYSSMLFDQPLIEGVLLKRYKRFLADVLLPQTNETVLVHVPNSGSMLGVNDPGSLCRISISNNPSRKIPYTLEMVRGKGGSWVGVNTSISNKLVAEAFEKNLTNCWTEYDGFQREIKVGTKSRLDFVFTKGKIKCYVEVKNVSMAQPPYAVFPDSVTERGQKHLNELMTLSKQGNFAEIFFVVQREDCTIFRPCDDIDPEYGKLLRKAAKNKVVIRCWSCEISPTSITISKELQIDLD